MKKQVTRAAVLTICLLEMSSTALAASWNDALQQLARNIPSVQQVLQGTAATVPVAPVTPATSEKDAADTQQEQPAKVPAVQASHLEVVLLLDKSGSMKGLETDTITGYNNMLAKERKLSVPTNVTTILFSSDQEMLADRAAIADVPDMTADSYHVHGATALYDTIGKAIEKTRTVKGIDDPGSKVLFVIITDGLENYSQTYDQEQIKKMIDAQEEQGWEFVFIGANMDAEKEADTIGIKKENAATYENSEQGVQANYQAVSRMMNSLAATSSLIGSSWKNSIVPGK